MGTRDGGGGSLSLRPPGRIRNPGNPPGTRTSSSKWCGSFFRRRWKGSGMGGCVPLFGSGVPKVGTPGSTERWEIGYFRMCQGGTVRATLVRRDG